MGAPINSTSAVAAAVHMRLVSNRFNECSAVIEEQIIYMYGCIAVDE